MDRKYKSSRPFQIVAYQNLPNKKHETNLGEPKLCVQLAIEA